ncbi:MAG: hypothetical protein HYV78_00470 [Candidatus Wildermuthbacteria bacterium]|nr:hypothetical protein [Candidatus Wildermuthbacteria bacterium]
MSWYQQLEKISIEARRSSIIRALMYALLIAPVAAAFLAVLVFTVGGTPTSDEWSIVPYFQYKADGTLSLVKLAEWYKVHRYLFPRILILGLGSITGWDIEWETLVGFLFLCATVFLIFQRYRAQKGNLWLFVPVGFMLFSLRQHENLFWGFQMAIYMAILGSIYALWLLDRKVSFLHLTGALVSAFIATFSFGMGPAVWPAGAALLLLKRQWKHLFLWIGTAVVVMAFYLQGFEVRGQQPTLLMTGALFQIGTGAPFAFSADVIRNKAYSLVDAVVAANMAFAVFTAIGMGIYASWKKQGGNAFWCALGLFGLGTVALITHAEASVFVSRYSSFTMLAPVAAYVLTLHAKEKWMKTLGAILGAMILVSVTAAFAYAPKVAQDMAALRWNQYYSMTKGFVPYDVDFSKEEIVGHAWTMARLKIGIYRPNPREYSGRIQKIRSKLFWLLL